MIQFFQTGQSDIKKTLPFILYMIKNKTLVNMSKCRIYLYVNYARIVDK